MKHDIENYLVSKRIWSMNCSSPIAPISRHLPALTLHYIFEIGSAVALFNEYDGR